MCKAGRTEAGYTYVTALVALVALALAAQVTFTPTATEVRRAAEAEMLFRGRAYARAINSYHEAQPGAPAYPERLEHLLDDPRSDGRRHIRRLYTPGLPGDWEKIEAAQGGILGVSLTLPEPPFRRNQLPADVELEETSGGETVIIFFAASAAQ